MKSTLMALALVGWSLLFAFTGVAQTQHAIPAGSKVYIAPMNGFETYMAAALQKKKVPVTIVADEHAADYIISGNNEHQKAGWAKTIFMGNIHSDEQASIQVTNAETKEVVFAYAVNKKNTWHGQQTSAEACAKHLKEAIEKGAH